MESVPGISVKAIDRDLAQRGAHLTLEDLFGQHSVEVLALVRQHRDELYYQALESSITKQKAPNKQPANRKKRKADEVTAAPDGEEVEAVSAQPPRKLSEMARMAGEVRKCLKSWPEDSYPRLRMFAINLVAAYAKDKKNNIEALRVALGTCNQYNVFMTEGADEKDMEARFDPPDSFAYADTYQSPVSQ